MDLTNALTYLTLLLTFILTIIVEISAKPASSNRLDDRYYPSYEAYSKSNARLEGSIGNLKRGYYYIDDGFIVPVKASDALAAANRRTPTGRRRLDTNEGDNLPDGVKFTPLVRYKQTKTKRKKLFVPNFFG